METRIEIDINAHSPTNDEMCKIITGKKYFGFCTRITDKSEIWLSVWQNSIVKIGSQADTNRPNSTPLNTFWNFNEIW